jgi:DNA invertase Pin-like site-specific DNA recombinase
MKIARIYLRVSSKEQDLARQESIIDDARKAGYYVAGVYREKASGISVDRPELQRMLADLQPGDVVIAEKIDRISRLPLPDAERLVAAISDKGAKIAVPGIVDLSEIAAEGIPKIVLESVQTMLLRIALQMAREDYEVRRHRQHQGIALAKQAGKFRGRKSNARLHEQIIALRTGGTSIARTAELAGCSETTVKTVWRKKKPKMLEGV